MVPLQYFQSLYFFHVKLNASSVYSLVRFGLVSEKNDEIQQKIKYFSHFTIDLQKNLPKY